MALLPQDPQKQKLLLIGMLPLLGLFGYYQFLHGKSTEKIRAAESRLETLEAGNGPARVQAQQGGPELEKKLEIYNQHMLRLEQLIPAREEVPDLLHSMTLRAEDTGVELANMKPEVEQPGQFYSRQTYEMGVIGSFHRVVEFLTAVGSLQRIVTPIDVQMGARNRQTRDGLMQLEVRFRVETFIIPPAAAPAGAPNATS